MNITEQDIAQAVSAVHDDVIAQSALDRLQRIIDSGDSERLISAIVSSERATNESEEDAIGKTMRKLESLANTSQTIACLLMVRLGAIAGNFRMHEIVDRIDFWIWECNSSELTRELDRLTRSEDDAINRKYYERLMKVRSESNAARSPAPAVEAEFPSSTPLPLQSRSQHG